jgi:hypothetical protein
MSAKDWSEIFEWRVDDDGVTITKFLQEGATSVDVPNEIDGKPVVAIGDHAFYCSLFCSAASSSFSACILASSLRMRLTL